MSGGDPKRFIADVMVGKLARYLRMAGYDTAYSNEADDDEIMETARREERTVLTRDTMMLKRRAFTRGVLDSVYIKDDSLEKQLLQVASYLGVSLRPRLVICLVCNSRLQKVGKEEIRGRVPPYVFKTRDDFSRCEGCGRYYWRGTHYDYIKKYFSRLDRLI